MNSQFYQRPLSWEIDESRLCVTICVGGEEERAWRNCCSSFCLYTKIKYELCSFLLPLPYPSHLLLSPSLLFPFLPLLSSPPSSTLTFACMLNNCSAALISLSCCGAKENKEKSQKTRDSSLVIYKRREKRRDREHRREEENMMREEKREEEVRG